MSTLDIYEISAAAQTSHHILDQDYILSEIRSELCLLIHISHQSTATGPWRVSSMTLSGWPVFHRVLHRVFIMLFTVSFWYFMYLRTTGNVCAKAHADALECHSIQKNKEYYYRAHLFILTPCLNYDDPRWTFSEYIAKSLFMRHMRSRMK